MLAHKYAGVTLQDYDEIPKIVSEYGSSETEASVDLHRSADSEAAQRVLKKMLIIALSCYQNWADVPITYLDPTPLTEEALFPVESPFVEIRLYSAIVPSSARTCGW